MRAENAVVQTTAKSKGFSTLINSPNYRQMIDKSIGDPRRAAAFVSTMISVVNMTPKLQECNVGTLISAALRGEVGMNLSLALGDYSIVPYGQSAQFIISANGLKQLAIRSGNYSDIGFFDVREGEYKGRDKRTRKPIFEWIEDEDERETKPIVGYYGFYILNSQYNNFFQCIYWSHERILQHADRYSKAFSLKKYRDLLDGKVSSNEAYKLQNGSPWYGDPNSLGHQKMCIKTIAKQLLGDGLAPKEIQEVISQDNEQEASEEAIIYAPTEPVAPSDLTAAQPQDPETPENVIDVTPEQIEPSSADSFFDD